MDNALLDLIQLFFFPIIFLGSGGWLFKHLWSLSSSLEKDYSKKIELIKDRKIAELAVYKTKFCEMNLPLFDLENEGDKPQMAEINIKTDSIFSEFRGKINEIQYWEFTLIDTKNKAKNLAYLSIGLTILLTIEMFLFQIPIWNFIQIFDPTTPFGAIVSINSLFFSVGGFIFFILYSIISLEKSMRKWDKEYYQKP